MDRRRYLGVAVTATAALAGCSGVLSSGPDAAIEQFYQAVDDGDREAANDLIHSESPVGKLTEDDMARFEDMDITVESTEVVEESDDTAQVEAELTMESDGESSTETITYELRKENGGWKLYE